MSIEWQERYKIGNVQADASQKRLFELANEIIATDDWIALRPSIVALFKQMQKQFDLEDALLAQLTKPEAKAQAQSHLQAHHDLLMRLRDRSMDVGKGQMNKKAIVAVVTEWATQHVTKEDAQLAQALAA